MERQNWKSSAKRRGETEQVIISVITIDTLVVEGIVDKLDI